ncbi:MAG: hypothetical protein U9Q03_00200 [Patescibacteria group bacterium]|nr:hypothetical protein [Patescibacteria group bacterium]
MMKKNILLGVLGVGVIAAAVIVLILQAGNEPGLDTEHDGIEESVEQNTGGAHSQAMLVYDPSDLREVAGFFPEIFVARVVEQLDAFKAHEIEEFDFVLVNTPFTVEVLYPMKGNTEGVVTLVLEGGHYNETVVAPAGDFMVGSPKLDSDDDESYILGVGKTYIFASRYDEDEDRYYAGSTRESRMPLDIDSSLDAEAAYGSIKEQSNFREMEEAIREQIPSRHNIRF